MARLLLDKITKTYPGNILALNQFALEIQDGEFVVLLGPSGSGKSTLLRVVSGLEETHQGKIILGNRDVTHLSPKERDVAMVFQNNALYPHMSVYDNIAFPLRLRKLPSQEIDERTRETAAILGIEALLPRKPGTLSGGERQRAALGKAIVRRPKVFLLDEPLSSLDARLRLQMREEIKSLQRKLKITVLYVTHDQEEAMCLGDRLVLLDHGSMQQVGRPEELYHCPANRFVASFLGAPAINLLAGQSIKVCLDLAQAHIFASGDEGCNLTLP